MAINTTGFNGVRADCVRDNRATPLPNAYTFGFGLTHAARGNWVTIRENDSNQYGRAVGGVTADGKRYLECIVLLGALDNPCVRWIDPAYVSHCLPSPPKAPIEFMLGEWQDPVVIIEQVQRGFPINPDWLGG
jgi:hypothetical protein